MNTIQHHQLKITTLSPVHIGCNETYEPTNYVIEDDALYEFSAQQAIDALHKQQREQLLKVVNAKADESLLKNVQAFFHDHRQSMIALSTHYLPVGQGVARLYAERVGKTAQHETGGKKVINKLEIERTAYNPSDRKPVFPGSSIKGAIRTAMLDALNKGQPLPHILKGEKQANRKLQEQLLKGKFHTDPFRLVSLSDARWNDTAIPVASEVRFAVNRRRKKMIKDGQLVRSQAEQKGLYQLLETVQPFRYRALELSINLDQPGKMLGNNKKTPELQWRIEDIAKACNAFYRPILQKELELVDKLGYADPQWVEKIKKILNDLEAGHTFLLRVGRHSGAESVTLNGVRSIKIMKGKGNKPSWEPEPKTVWLAAPDTKSESGMLPFGWILLEIDPHLEAPWAGALNHNTGLSHDWVDGKEKRQREYRRVLGEEKARAAKREKEQLEAERKAAEEAAALESMGPEQRRLHELEKQLEKDIKANNKAPGGQLNDMRLKLMVNALDWEDAGLRQQAVALLRRTAKHLPWAKKRKKDIQDKLQQLEQ